MTWRSPYVDDSFRCPRTGRSPAHVRASIVQGMLTMRQAPDSHRAAMTHGLQCQFSLLFSMGRPCRTCHARLLSGLKHVAEFLHHEFKRSDVAGGLNNGHERFHAEFCAGVIRIGFTHEGRVGLADGRRDGLGRHLAVDHGFVDGLDDL